MLYLILSVVSSCLIFVIFKLLNKYKLQLLPVIVVNYITASIIGYLLRNQDFTVDEIIHAEWFYISIVIGIMFILMFYTIGFSTQKAGITITSISTKMSVVIPMLFSILYYREEIYLLKIAGIILALFSIFLASQNGKEHNQETRNYIFPLLLFFGMGIVDSTVKFNQEEYLQNTGVLESTTIVFNVSAIIGIIVLLVFKLKKVKIKVSTLIFGITLGLANFGSLYFLIMALNAKFLDSSIIFAINNTAIILISVLIGKIFFSELLSKLNWIGVFSSVVAILILSV